jgi:hypothetical protein
MSGPPSACNRGRRSGGVASFKSTLGSPHHDEARRGSRERRPAALGMVMNNCCASAPPQETPKTSTALRRACPAAGRPAATASSAGREPRGRRAADTRDVRHDPRAPEPLGEGTTVSRPAPMPLKTSSVLGIDRPHHRNAQVLPGDLRVRISASPVITQPPGRSCQASMPGLCFFDPSVWCRDLVAAIRAQPIGPVACNCPDGSRRRPGTPRPSADWRHWSGTGLGVAWGLISDWMWPDWLSTSCHFPPRPLVVG